jgi:non-reducing end alpha-L-arabinofuranosidase
VGRLVSPVNGELYGWSTANVTANAWTALNQSTFTQPMHAKHVTVTGITAAEMTGLLNRWGAPAWNRIKSSNFPDRYVRHANSIGRIDPYPFDPYADQQWRIVPGLADAAGISFQSVNAPTRYLRHSGYAIRLDPNDGTAGFRADATFTRVAGLADSGRSSFRSYNFPDRYLRHSGYVLRIDPISASSPAVDRQDATFQIVY